LGHWLAPVSGVWDVLVKKQYIEQWVNKFLEGNVLTEDWHLSGNMAMNDDNGALLIKGTVTLHNNYCGKEART
jgi:hypothetical protein